MLPVTNLLVTASQSCPVRLCTESALAAGGGCRLELGSVASVADRAASLPRRPGRSAAEDQHGRHQTGRRRQPAAEGAAAGRPAAHAGANLRPQLPGHLQRPHR